MKPVREAYWNSEKWREKNLRYFPYYGRGYVQLTWKKNYLKAGKELGYGESLANKPDKVMETGISAKILVLGSKEGWFTGKRLGDYINDNQTDYLNARRVINGRDKQYEIAAWANKYYEALESEFPPNRGATGTWGKSRGLRDILKAFRLRFQ